MEAAKKNRNVLVVGGGGYVGNAVVRHLLREGYGVRVLDSFIFDQATALADLIEDPAFSLQRGDLRKADDVDRALEGVTDVVLLAALVGDPACKRYPELAHEVNEAGAQLLFERMSANEIDRFVFTSTCSNYGLRETDDLATEESELAPVSLYAELKVAFEQHILGNAANSGFCPTILRISTAYGLSQRMRFDLTISEFTRTLTIGDELLVYDADTWRPYCHVRDIARAIDTVFTSPAEEVREEVFNVGHSDENYTKRMLVEAVQEHLGGAGKVSYHEGGVDPRNYRVSFEKIRERLGFETVYRVPSSIGELVGAIQSGLFDDVEARPFFYASHTIPGVKVPGDAEGTD